MLLKDHYGVEIGEIMNRFWTKIQWVTLRIHQVRQSQRKGKSMMEYSQE